jgi:hypothetical protein
VPAQRDPGLTFRSVRTSRLTRTTRSVCSVTNNPRSVAVDHGEQEGGRWRGGRASRRRPERRRALSPSDEHGDGRGPDGTTAPSPYVTGTYSVKRVRPHAGVGAVQRHLRAVWVAGGERTRRTFRSVEFVVSTGDNVVRLRSPNTRQTGHREGGQALDRRRGRCVSSDGEPRVSGCYPARARRSRVRRNGTTGVKPVRQPAPTSVSARPA